MRLPDPARSRAILIGAARFTAPGLPDLPAVRANVEDLARALTDPRTGVLDPGRCMATTDPSTPHETGTWLAERCAQAEDLLLVYYAGHGLLDTRGALHLALTITDADPSRLRFTALPLQWVRDALEDSPAAVRALVLDCCFSGRAIETMAETGSLVGGQLDIRGTYTLTSTAANVAALAPSGHTHTAFTGELLRLLLHGPPTGADPLTLDDAYRHLDTALRSRQLPRPQCRAVNTAADLIISRAVPTHVDVTPPDLPNTEAIPLLTPRTERAQFSRPLVDWRNPAFLPRVLAATAIGLLELWIAISAGSFIADQALAALSDFFLFTLMFYFMFAVLYRPLKPLLRRYTLVLDRNGLEDAQWQPPRPLPLAYRRADDARRPGPRQAVAGPVAPSRPPRPDREVRTPLRLRPRRRTRLQPSQVPGKAYGDPGGFTTLRWNGLAPSTHLNCRLLSMYSRPRSFRSRHSPRAEAVLAI